MILERIKQFIDYKGMTIASFERSIGMANASFGKSLKNKGAIGTDKLENILKTYPELSPNWLLVGEGDMIKTKCTPPKPNYDDSHICHDKDKNNHSVNQMFITDIIDKFLAAIKEKDNQILEQSNMITEQAAQISRLEERIRQMTIEKEKHVSDASISGTANVG